MRPLIQCASYAATSLLHTHGLANHRHGDVRHDVGMKHNGDGKLTDLLQRSLWHSDHRFFDGVTLCLQCFHDVDVGHRSEQTAVDTCLLCDPNGETIELGGL